VRRLLDRFGIRRAESTALRRVPDFAVGSFVQVDKAQEVRQGEILGNIKYYYWEENKDDPNLTDVSSFLLSYAVVSTPDCDLLQDFKARRKRLAGTLFSILLFGAEPPDRAKQRTGFGAKEWKYVLQNRIDQFHFLDFSGMIHGGTGDPAQGLVVDFKRYFTLTPQELYRQFTNNDIASQCRRVCRLGDLWREDFQRRAMSYMQRVALPDPSDENEQ
jgi:hypothetical protein